MVRKNWCDNIEVLSKEFRWSSIATVAKAESEESYCEYEKKEPGTLAATSSVPVCLPYLQAVLFANVLEDSIMQLRVIDALNNELRVTKVRADMDTLRAKKFHIQKGGSEDKLAGVDASNIGSNQFKLDKLVADRVYCAEVMIGTYLELAMHRSYTSLVDSNKDIEDRDAYRIRLVEEEAKNKNDRRDLLRQLRQHRNHIKSVLYDTDALMDQLKSQVEDATLNANTRGRYVENWQLARSEQHNQTIHDVEAGPSESIEYYRDRSEQEQRIHYEVELLVNIFIDEILKEVESWMNKYDTDTEALDLKIQIMKSKFIDVTEYKNKMEATYAEHVELMNNWLQFKKDREEARLYSLKMTNAAVAVQAWWRGLLVRLELGPYKPKRKPKGAEKTEKKKKK